MPPHVLGIALDTTTITMVRLAGTAKSYSLVQALEQTLPQHPDPDEQTELQQQTLRDLVDTHRLRGDTVLVALPAHHATLHTLSFPFKDSRRIRQTLKFALDEHMPFEPEEVVVDFQPLPFGRGNRSELLVAGVQQQEVAATLALFQSAGLEPTVLDLDVFGLANAVVLGSMPLPQRTVLLDVQPVRTLITVLYQNVPVFARSLRRNEVFLPSVSPTETLRLPDPKFLEKQVQQTLYACEKALRQPFEPEALLLSGMFGESLGLLAIMLEETLGIPAQLWRVTASNYKGTSPQAAGVDPALHAVAFGTALRGLHRQACGVNLRREQFALYRDLQEMRGKLVALGVLVVAVAGLSLGSLYLNVHHKTQRQRQLQEEVSRLFQASLPGARMVQPVAQMKTKMDDLEKRLQAFGGVTGAQLSGLQVLKEVSARIPPTLVVEIDTMTITADTIDMNGSTASYDDVDKLKDALALSPFLHQVKINNSRQTPTNKVEFKLSLKIVKSLDSAS